MTGLKQGQAGESTIGIVCCAYHMLHANRDLIVETKVAVEAHNMGRVTLVEHFKLPHNLIPHCWLDVQHDHLSHNRQQSEWHSRHTHPALSPPCTPIITLQRPSPYNRVTCIQQVYT